MIWIWIESICSSPSGSKCARIMNLNKQLPISILVWTFCDSTQRVNDSLANRCYKTTERSFFCLNYNFVNMMLKCYKIVYLAYAHIAWVGQNPTLNQRCRVWAFGEVFEELISMLLYATKPNEIYKKTPIKYKY